MLWKACEEIKGIVERLKEIMVEGKRSDGIMFKKTGQKSSKDSGQQGK